MERADVKLHLIWNGQTLKKSDNLQKCHRSFLMLDFFWADVIGVTL